MLKLKMTMTLAYQLQSWSWRPPPLPPYWDQISVLRALPTCPHPAFRPVKLLKDRLKVLHGSVCDQHDGLVTHAALAVHPHLHTNTHIQIQTNNFHLLDVRLDYTCFTEDGNSSFIYTWMCFCHTGHKPHWGFWRLPSWHSWSLLLL